MPPFADMQQQYLNAISSINSRQHDNVNSINSTNVSKTKSNKKQKHIRRVTFAKTGTAMRVRHINDYRPSEKRNCWYTPAENRAIRDDVMDNIAALRQVINSKSKTTEAQDGIVRRGIECRMREAVEARQDLKRRITLVVLEEQRLQRDEGSNDVEYIAMMYGRQCVSSQEEARHRAARDAHDAAMS